MAALEKIRQQGVLLSIVIGVAMLLFIIGMIDLNSIFGIGNKVGEIDGVDIAYEDYSKQVNIMSEMNKSQNGPAQDFNSSVWSKLIQNTLYENQCEKIGLAVSDDEVGRALTDPNIMGVPQDYALQLMQAAKANPGGEEAMRWQQIKDDVYHSLLSQKYMSLVAPSFNVNNIDAKYAFDSKRAADIEYVKVAVSTIADDKVSEVTEDEINEYYNAHKNNYYIRNEERTIDYMVYGKEPSQADFDAEKKRFDDMKEEFYKGDYNKVLSQIGSDDQYENIALSKKFIDSDLAEFAFSAPKDSAMGPQLFGKTYKMAKVIETGIKEADSLVVRAIALQRATPEATELQADSVMQMLASGLDFGAAADKYSLMDSKAPETYTYRNVGQSINNELYDLFQKAQVGAPFTYPTVKDTADKRSTIYIFQVDDKRDIVDKVNLCVVSRKVLVSSATSTDIYNDASAYMAQHRTISEFEDSAKAEKGLYIIPSTLKKDMYSFGGIQNSRQIVVWAFNAEEGDVADKVFDCDDKYVIAALKSVTEKGYKPLSAVKDEIVQAIMSEKKADLIARDLNKKIAKGSLAAAGEVQTATGISLSSSMVTDYMSEYNLIAAIAAMKEGGKPKVVKCKNAVFAVNVTSVAPQDKFDAAVELQNTSSTVGGYAIEQSLLIGADIEDNRADIEKNSYR